MVFHIQRNSIEELKMGMKSTEQERKVMRECTYEAFWYRAVPSALLAGASMYWGVKSGKLKPNQRLGPWPKVIGASSLAYVVAKMSYILGQNCINKFLKQAPNSDIARHFRHKHGLVEPESEDSSTFIDQQEVEQQSNLGLGEILDIVDKNDFDPTKMSEKEQQILEDCNTAAFYQYSLPMTFGVGATVYATINRLPGFQGKSMFVRCLPVALGSATGYILGQVLYLYSGDCTNRFLQFAPEGEIASRLAHQEEHIDGERSRLSMCEGCQASAVLEEDLDEYVIPNDGDIELRDVVGTSVHKWHK